MRRNTHTLAAAFLVFLARPSTAYPQATMSTHLRIGVITPRDFTTNSDVASALDGVRLGAAEGKQTANLFGSDVELFEVPATGARAVAQAALFLSSRRQVQVIIGINAADADAISRFADANHILFLNAGSRVRSIRLACRRNTFHITANDAMYANAARYSPGDSVVAWDAALQRFGASQLNDRYRAMFKSTMTAAAWAGWAAAKIATESALRAHSTTAEKLIGYMESASTQFDGHKGWPLTFRAADHQLRQPLYIVGKIGTPQPTQRALRDVPELRFLSQSRTEGAAAMLDRLNAGGGAHCSWTRP